MAVESVNRRGRTRLLADGSIIEAQGPSKARRPPRITTMLNPWKRRDTTGLRSTKHRQSRAPITIGFEQLEGREMLSTGVALTIIPTETRPLLSMPRPYVGTFNPEAKIAISVSTKPGTDSKARKANPNLWPTCGRFRWRGIDLG
jgi:hypothetical protein